MRILVADDDQVSRQLLAISLKKVGHEVILAEDGQEAWQLMQQLYFPLVISDWLMPEIDGLELCERIRNFRPEPYTYIILLTSRTDKSSLLEAFDAGVDDFLPKPFDFSELMARIHSGERVLHLEDQLDSRIQELSRANSRMKRDLVAAARIQEALLPAVFPTTRHLKFAWQFKPCEELAGDTLNIVSLGKNQVGIYVLDVSGHGVAAALMSVTLNRFLSPMPGYSILLETDPVNTEQRMVVSPAKVLNKLNSMFQISELTGGQYFTIVYGIFDIERATFTFSVAGHPTVIVHRAQGEPELLLGSGLPIGFSELGDYQEEKIKLSSGDRVVLYSDGLTEAINEKGLTFGSERIFESLIETREKSLNESISAIMQYAQKWIQRRKPDDDITLLGAEWV